jgi:sulfatase maturation enzyme AslB (radical SAM superfamily)
MSFWTIRGHTVTNGLQTNGVLIDEQWADFLADERFSVGLSLDGPRDLHDVYRRNGSPAYQRFFHHCRPVMEQLAVHLRAGLALGVFAARLRTKARKSRRSRDDR